MTAETTPTLIPGEWRDPRYVVPHLTHELGDWYLSMKAIEHDLAVIQGGLDPQSGVPKVPPEQLREWVMAVHARMVELNHQVASRLQAFVLISDDLKRNGGPDGS